VFHKYSSIENSYRNKTIQLIRECGWDKLEWCVTCKAHGSNLSIQRTAEEIIYNKRSGPIVNDNFYSYECMVEREESKFKSLFSDLGRDTIIYGELLGGNYPDVEKYNEVCVQKGVYYSPKTEFYAFDLYVDGFINYDEATRLFDKHGLLYARILFRGTLDECLQHPNEFQDPISQELGWPQIDGNTCEGVVIKPLNYLEFGNGSRVILKNKNEKFLEKKQGQPKVTIDTSLTDESQILYTSLSAFITENRLNNVLSKVGQVTQKDFGKIVGLFTQDVLMDSEKDGISLDGIGNQQKKFLKKRINSDCAEILRKDFVNILDRNQDA